MGNFAQSVTFGAMPLSEDNAKADVIERVRKILAKTEASGCSEAEAALAFQKASRILAEHNLDMSDVEAKDEGSQSWTEDDIYETGRWTLEDNLAHGIVSRYFFVEGFFAGKWANGKHRKVLRFFGQPHNVATARWAFSALQEAFDRLFNEWRQRTGGPASDRRMFIAGVASGFDEKMRDERKAMEIERDLVQGKSNGSTALAVVSISEQTRLAYRAAHASFFHKDGKQKGSKIKFDAVTGSNSALAAGYQAGRNLELNRAIGGSKASFAKLTSTR
jgi:Protein of unknown function (DUF2786)